MSRRSAAERDTVKQPSMADVKRSLEAKKVAKWRESVSYDHDFWKDDIKKDEHGLTPNQVAAFKEVFNLFDINGGGSIDADELDAALKTVDVHLTHVEIKEVLMLIDEDGNGEIDFDEFLTLMTSTEKFLENLRGGTSATKEEGNENILFSALAKFMRKSALSSLTEIERYYNSRVRKSPHVVGHYAAGARLIGLTEKQMAKHLANLSITDGENNDSPYAQPLCMFHSNIPNTRTKILSKRKGKGKIRLTIITKNPDDSSRQEDKDGEQKKVGSDNLDGAENNSDDEKPLSNPAESRPANRPRLNRCQKAPLTLRPTSVPLPAVSIRGIRRKNPSMLTIEDLPIIRQKVQMAYENYRRKQVSVREDIAQVCAFTDISQIPSRNLQKQFKIILEAYSYKPTNVPSSLELPCILQPHLVF